MMLVELFTKADCPRCDEARTLLEQIRTSIPFSLNEIRIHEGDAWYEEYGDIVPVVHIDRVPVFRHRLHERLVRIRLQQLAAGSSRPATEDDQDAGEVIR